MSPLISLAVGAAVIAAAQASEWSLTNMQPVTSLCGLHATADDEVFAAVSDNAQGPGLEHSVDYGATDDFMPASNLLNMDVTFTSTAVDGTVVGMGTFVVTHDGKTFERQSGDTKGVSQGVSSYGDSTIGAAGDFYTKSTRVHANGVAVSHDRGDNWNLFDLGLNSSSNMARYVALPSEDTWYVTSGMWPSDDEEYTVDGLRGSVAMMARMQKFETEHGVDAIFPAEGEELSFRLSERLTRRVSASGKHTIDYKHPAPGSGPGAKAGRAIDDSSWYYGSVSKTTDGGATWEKVCDLHGLSYFNGIHCADTEHCMAVSENSENAFVYSTTDGGKIWKQVMVTEPLVSLMGSYMLSPTEAWVSGGTQVNGQLTGYFYHTVDGGETWELESLTNALSMDIIFSKDGNVGYSTALSRAASTVAVYK